MTVLDDPILPPQQTVPAARIAGEEGIRSDLRRIDQLRDGDIDIEDAPVPDLADWVRHARPFSGNRPQADS